MRLLYGAPPDPGRWQRKLDEALPKMAEEIARQKRIAREKELLGVALFNLLAPLSGEEPIE